MTKERLNEFDDSTLISFYASSSSLKEKDDISSILRERGYHFKGFTWSKNPDDVDPVEAMRKRVLGE